MGFEVDFLAVGEESSGGDAIALRYGDLFGDRPDQTVIVIDGGYRDSGQALVQLIKQHYDTDFVNVVVSTHPDQDHSSGLAVILEELEVGNLLMHLPWQHSDELRAAKAASFISFASNKSLEASLKQVSELEQIAARKGIPITEPFAGLATSDGCFRILGPTEDYYKLLLPEIAYASRSERARSLVSAVKERVLRFVNETLLQETLRDDGETTPGNNSSVISLFEHDGRKLLFTGDAGIPALDQALTQLEANGFSPGELSFVQIPHHGSRRNVGPTVLNRMLGSTFQDNARATAVVSVPKKNPENKHPSKKVTNAFRRRGYTVHATKGTSKWHYFDAPERAGYSASEALPFFDQVEEDSGT